MSTSRRSFLGYAGAGGAGLLGGVTVGRMLDQDPEALHASPRTIAPYGDHQPGVAAHPTGALRLVALDLKRSATREALGRLMRSWTGDIEAAALGRPLPGDTAPDLAEAGREVTVTVGFGVALFDRLRLDRPAGVRPVPPMRHDRLRSQWCGGDLLVRLEATDDTTLAHLSRRIVRDADPFASVRWEQVGSWRGRDSTGRPVTGRNLFGQVDGTGNPAPGTPDFDATVWIDQGPWTGGSTLVVRRIKMGLDTWDALTRHEQEAAIGRRLSDGAPLGGQREQDPLDLEARDADGNPVIPLGAHARLSHPAQNGGVRIFRKGANYTETVGGVRESGLIFQSFQADIGAQFIPLQTKLDTLDDLNTWTVAVGSAEFALLPGFQEGDWLGRAVLGD